MFGRVRAFMTWAVTLALAGACVPTSAQTGADWPSYRGKAQMTGVAHSPLPATLSLKWTYETGSSVESTAAIVGDTVYVGTMTGALVAINLSSGRFKWKFVTGGDAMQSIPRTGNSAGSSGPTDRSVHPPRRSVGRCSSAPMTVIFTSWTRQPAL